MTSPIFPISTSLPVMIHPSLGSARKGNNNADFVSHLDSAAGDPPPIRSKGNLHIFGYSINSDQPVRPCRLPLRAWDGSGVCRETEGNPSAPSVRHRRGSFHVRRPALTTNATN